MPAGNCFENSLRYLIDQSIDNPQRKLTLVHCNVVGTGGEPEGKAYCHAFVIEKVDIPGLTAGHIGDPFIEMAIDVAKDYNNPTMIPLAYYRELGQVSNEIHFDLSDTRKLMKRFDTYGPWNDELITDTDRAAETELNSPMKNGNY